MSIPRHPWAAQRLLRPFAAPGSPRFPLSPELPLIPAQPSPAAPAQPSSCAAPDTLSQTTQTLFGRHPKTSCHSIPADRTHGPERGEGPGDPQPVPRWAQAGLWEPELQPWERDGAPDRARGCWGPEGALHRRSPKPGPETEAQRLFAIGRPECGEHTRAPALAGSLSRQKEVTGPFVLTVAKPLPQKKDRKNPFAERDNAPSSSRARVAPGPPRRSAAPTRSARRERRAPSPAPGN